MRSPDQPIASPVSLVPALPENSPRTALWPSKVVFEVLSRLSVPEVVTPRSTPGRACASSAVGRLGVTVADSTTTCAAESAAITICSCSGPYDDGTVLGTGAFGNLARKCPDAEL